MQTRTLGDADHESTIATSGAIALNWLEQEGANQMVEHVPSKGVNHFDVAPTCGDAELRLGPKLCQHREDISFGCEAQERSREGVKRRLDRSFDRLGVDHIGLHQAYGLEYESELDKITVDDGVLTALCETKSEGKIGHIGLTSHGNPGFIHDVVDRTDGLETLMFPLNPAVAGKDDDEHDYEGVFRAAEETGIGTFGIKTFARGPWSDTDELSEADWPFPNWYKPVDTPNEIVERFDFAVAQGPTSVIAPGDPKLVVMVLDAVTRYDGMGEAVQRSLAERPRHDESPVPEQLHY